MSDTIDRQAAIEGLYSILFDDEMRPTMVSAKQADKIIDVVRKLPDTEPEIIACGDCKYWICHDRRCGYWNHGVKVIDWCSHAERREE